MRRSAWVLVAVMAVSPVIASSADFGPSAQHDAFKEAFNSRDWEKVRSLLADDVVFQRANSTDVHAGPDAVIGNLDGTIASQWHVKFSKLDPTDHLVGKDGRVVERGDFAVTAGEASDSCYAGSYMMTWVPKGDGWALQVLNWQDVETEMSNC